VLQTRFAGCERDPVAGSGSGAVRSGAIHERREEVKKKEREKKCNGHVKKKVTDFLSLAATNGRIKTRVTFLFFCHNWIVGWARPILK
jgi:hypothetical protein